MTLPVAQRARALAPLRHSAFRWLALGRFTTFVGNGVAPVALGFAVLDLTGSVTDLALVVGARSAANVAFMLFGGLLADRLPRAVVLQGAALVAAAIQAVVAGAVLGGFATIAMLVALSVLNGAAAAIALPTAAALTPQTVPPAELQSANVLIRMSVSGALVLGAAIGGIVVAGVGPGWGLAADALSFALASLFYARIKIAAVAARAARRSPFVDLRDGWTEFRSRTWVWAVVLQFMIVNACIVGAVSVIGPLIADGSIGRRGWGLVLAAETAGLILGGVVALHLRSRHALRFGVALIALESVPLVVLAEAPRLLLLIPAMLLSGLALEVLSVGWDVSLQENVPSDRLGRVYSYDALGSFAAIPIGQMLAGPLAELYGADVVLRWGAALIVLASAGTLASRSVRSLERAPSTPAPTLTNADPGFHARMHSSSEPDLVPVEASAESGAARR